MQEIKSIKDKMEKDKDPILTIQNLFLKLPPNRQSMLIESLWKFITIDNDNIYSILKPLKVYIYILFIIYS